MTGCGNKSCAGRSSFAVLSVAGDTDSKQTRERAATRFGNCDENFSLAVDWPARQYVLRNEGARREKPSSRGARLQMNYDFTVIGAGIAGASVAYDCFLDQAIASLIGEMEKTILRTIAPAAAWPTSNTA